MVMLPVCGQHLEQQELGLPPSLTFSKPRINVKERSSFCYWDWEKGRRREAEEGGKGNRGRDMGAEGLKRGSHERGCSLGKSTGGTSRNKLACSVSALCGEHVYGPTMKPRTFSLLSL